MQPDRLAVTCTGSVAGNSDTSSSQMVLKRDRDGFAIPATRSAMRAKALPEEDYLSAMQAIIERDYFPDLRLHKAKQSMQKAMSDLKSEGRTPGCLSQLRAAESELRDAFSSAPSTPGARSVLSTTSTSTDLTDRNSTLGSIVNKHSLSSFLGKYTSEDNQSASQVLHTDATRKQRRKGWHSELVDKHNEKQLLLLNDKDNEGKKSANVITWVGNDVNKLHTYPEGLAVVETAEIAKRASKQIHSKSTRMDPEDIAANTKITAGMPGASLDHTSSYDLDTIKDSQHGETSFLGMEPSPMPGEDATPLMTWGHIAATPARITEASGPMFKMQAASKKDEKAISMARSVQRGVAGGSTSSLMSSGRRAGVSTPARGIPGAGTPRTPSGKQLSQAAMRLAYQLHGDGRSTPGKGHIKGSSSDSMGDISLRASYARSSSAAPVSSSRNGRSSRPQSGKARLSATPQRAFVSAGATSGGIAQSVVANQSSTQSMTDNLLQI